MFSKLLIVMTAAVVMVSAQGTTTTSAAAGAPTSIAGVTACILACIEPAAAQNRCSSITDVNCICASAQFQADAGACLKEHCPASDIEAALGLQTTQCSAAGLSATGSATPNPVSFTLSGSTGATGTAATATTSSSTTASGSKSAGTASASASTSTTSSAATSLVANGGLGAIIAMVAGLLTI